MKHQRYPGRLSLAEHQALAAKVRQIQREVAEVYGLVVDTWGLSHPATKALERVCLARSNPFDRVRCRLDDAFYRDPALRACRSPYFGAQPPEGRVDADPQNASGTESQICSEETCANVP